MRFFNRKKALAENCPDFSTMCSQVKSISSYSGGRDQEDHSLKPAQANRSARSYLEKPFCWDLKGPKPEKGSGQE
jgi:hypothetical protein